MYVCMHVDMHIGYILYVCMCIVTFVYIYVDPSRALRGCAASVRLCQLQQSRGGGEERRKKKKKKRRMIHLLSIYLHLLLSSPLLSSPSRARTSSDSIRGAARFLRPHTPAGKTASSSSSSSLIEYEYPPHPPSTSYPISTSRLHRAETRASLSHRWKCCVWFRRRPLRMYLTT